MSDLRFTLSSDGSSDRALIPILAWLLKELGVDRALQPAWADLRRLRRPPRAFVERIEQSLALYPCDLLFIHRDAERGTLPQRRDEILMAMEQVANRVKNVPPFVCVIPVRMQEAWLLSDEVAIRMAAGNRAGREHLQLPRTDQLENHPNPKDLLHNLLRQASGLPRRRRRKMKVREAVYRLAGLTGSFAPLRGLPAFQSLEAELEPVLRRNGYL